MWRQHDARRWARRRPGPPRRTRAPWPAGSRRGRRGRSCSHDVTASVRITAADPPADDRDEREGQDDVRDAEQDVDDAHDDRVGPAADQPASAPTMTPMIVSMSVTTNADEQRQADAVDDAGRTRRGRAGRCRTSAGASAAPADARPGCSGSCDEERSDDGHEHEEDDEDQPEHGELVAAETAPGVAARKRARRALTAVSGVDRSRPDLGSGSWARLAIGHLRSPPERMRGSNQA